MPSPTVPETDADGFLKDLALWSRPVAQALARHAGIELGADHWRVIELARDFHARTGVSPAMRPLVKLARERHGERLGTSIALMRLFSGNPAREIARIGGLPRPTDCP